jgi:hypothetical protein
MLTKINHYLKKSKSTNTKKALQLIGFIALFIYLYIEAEGKGDFHIFLQASQGLISGDNIYEMIYNECYHYYYSVLFSLIIYPLSFLPLHLTKFLWLSLNIYLIFRIFNTINRLLPIFIFTKKQKNIFWIIVFVFSLRLIHENLHVSQMTIFLLYSCLEGVSLITNKRVYTGAFLIAFAINIKLLPIVILPYLLYRKYFKATVLIILFYIFFFLLPILIIRWPQFIILVKSWWNLINPLNITHIIDVSERSFHSLTTLLSTLLIENAPDKFALPIKRNIANVSLEQLKKIILFIRLFFALFTVYFLRSIPFKKNKSLIHQFWELSYLLAIIPLIFPHQQHYAFLFIVPAYIYCILYLLNNYASLNLFKRFMIISTMIIIYLCVNLKLLLGEFNEYYEHFKILTYGAILLVVLLSLLIPKNQISKA